MTNALHSLPKQLDSYLVSYFFGTSATGIYYSAKTLFRVFEETLAAVQGLIYPAAVRYVERNDKVGLKIVMTKAVSFLFFAFLFIVIILQLGLSEFMITKFCSFKV
jgi:O-antigen/teichoic acid export membrane protein